MISVLIGPMYEMPAAPSGIKQRQRRLRPVSRRAQCVEPEHRNAGEHADALLALFVCRQVAAEEIV